MKKYNNILGFNVVECASVPKDVAALVDEVNRKILGEMIIPKEHFENLHSSGISAVEIGNDMKVKFLNKTDLCKEK